MFTRIMQPLFYVSYPLIVYFGYQHLPARQLGAVLLGAYALVAVINGGGSRADLGAIVRQHIPLAALIATAIVLDSAILLLFLPMLVSAFLLSTFALSLRNGPPMIERFARALEDDLPPFTLGYCRRVTIAWCIFMALNTMLIGVLTVAAPIEIWALYTGGIFYVLMGFLLVTEFCYRKWWFRFYGDGLLDRMFAAVFPANATARGRRSLEYDRARKLREAAETG